MGSLWTSLSERVDFITIGSQVRNFIRKNKTLTAGMIILGGIIFIAVFADVISPYNYAELHNNCGEEYPNCRFAPPSPQHLLGTNRLGRDVLSRLLHGSRVSLVMAVSAAIIGLSVGVPLGILSGYFGGPVDRLLTLVADAIYSFPSLLLAIMLSIVFVEFAEFRVVAAVSLSTAIVYIPIYFRIVRAQVLQVKEEAYIEAAKSIGARAPTILIRYIFPNVIAAPVALIAFNMTEAILTNAGLAFLGLGIQPPTADWGYDVYDNKSLSQVRRYPWLIFPPAIMIFLLAFSLTLIGDALNDKLNPLIAKKHETK